MSDTGTILSVKGLHVAFDGQPVVKDVSFDLRPGLCIGLVGASGSGKSVTSLALMGLLPGNAIVKGSIRLTGDDGPVSSTAFTRTNSAGTVGETWPWSSRNR